MERLEGDNERLCVKSDSFQIQTSDQGYKTFFMLNSVKHEFFLLINVKMPTIVGIFTVMSMKNSILGLSEPGKCLISLYFYTYEHLKFHA